MSKSLPTKPKLHLFSFSFIWNDWNLKNIFKWWNHQRRERVLQVRVNDIPRLRKCQFLPLFPLPHCFHPKNIGYDTQISFLLALLLIQNSLTWRLPVIYSLCHTKNNCNCAQNSLQKQFPKANVTFSCIMSSMIQVNTTTSSNLILNLIINYKHTINQTYTKKKKKDRRLERELEKKKF